MIIEFTGSPKNILKEWTRIVHSKDNWCFDDKLGAILDVEDRLDMNASTTTVRVSYNED